jgi:hydrogenase/urease accessory protein HupE
VTPASPMGIRPKLLCLIATLLLLIGLMPATGARAHEIRPALLNIVEQEAGWFEVTWKVPVLGEQVLSLRPILPPSLVPVGPPAKHTLPGAQIEFSTFKIEEGSLVGETILIEGLSAQQIDVLLQIALADGTTHSAILRPKSTSFVVPAEESSWEVASSYWIMGTTHILTGIDHLLFVLALMLIVPGYWMLFKTITAFTVAHSLSLGLAALGFVHVPPGPTEAVIALSILFLALEVVRSRQGKFGLTERAPWIVAFLFGLFHGLGFAGALTQIGLPEHAIPLALFMFNVGVETGQILFVSGVLVVTAALRRLPFAWPAESWRLAPYAIGSAAAFWTIERVTGFL